MRISRKAEVVIVVEIMRDACCLAIERDVPDLLWCSRALACCHQQAAPVSEPHGLADVMPVPGSERLLGPVFEPDADDCFVTAHLLVELALTADRFPSGRPRRRVPGHTKQVGLPRCGQLPLISPVRVSNNQTAL